ncbi:MAG: YggS family pyridoxal phosphate-dependent enzyme [Planctomycetota bacterium]|jgi:pyridoxal phosphate enzyme (YggS family)|nr:YggS family pyridoxal phosphate-dependent enzyme [Planctomycetota bacterium]
METIAENLQAVRDRMAAAADSCGRTAADIRLIAVTKNQGPEVLPELAANGVAAYGENRLEHLQAMHATASADMGFHFIGRVQGRQLPKIVPYCTAIHSLCELNHITRLARACDEQSRTIEVFLQVNTAGEVQKAGMEPAELAERIALVRTFPQLELQGLMCMAPDRSVANEATIRSGFAALRELAADHGLARLSMGMSGDYELAIAEGATDLRIGTTLFV